MNRDREKIVDILKELKQEYGVLSIKAEFEAEGTRKDELIMLREFLYQAELGLIVKIGGCEAMHDLDQCRLLNATGIMAPMIETPFAMSKFKKAAGKIYGDNMDAVEWIINAETITCLNNYDEILKEGQGFLSAVTVGRSDLSASMGIDRSDIEGEEVFKATYEMLKKSRDAGLMTNFGGNIGRESVPFIMKMSKVSDRVETRKVVMKAENDGAHMEKAIAEALRFELEYLKFKAKYYDRMAREDEARIERLSRQLDIG